MITGVPSSTLSYNACATAVGSATDPVVDPAVRYRFPPKLLLQEAS